MQEWDELPWWVAQMYWENLEREFTPPDQDVDAGEEENGSADRLADMGVQVRRKSVRKEGA